VGSISTPAHELDLLRLLLERLEREQFSSAPLIAMQTRWKLQNQLASVQIRRLHRLVDRLEWARNMMFTPIAAPLLWVPQHAMAIERWRIECGPHIGDWVAAVGEFEALASLACFAYERPSAVFPTLLDSSSPQIAAEALAHPLIAPEKAVPNDVALDSTTRLWIVSGSNMSGKSTLLRA